MKKTFKFLCGCALAVGTSVGCGDSGGRGDGAGDSAGSGSDSLTGATTDNGSTTEGSASGNTDSASGGATSGDTQTTDDSASTTAGTGPKFDVATMPDAGVDCGGDGGADFSYIWISNSPEGTVSKINTQTLVEEARYSTGPSAPDPSRTSVNLAGDVAVVNRAGSVTKIVARIDDCVDQNGTPGIQTSTGPGDVLPWGQDDCVMWNTPIGERSRPAAWTAGTEIMGDCGGFVDAQVWASAPSANTADTTVTVFLLDGDSGAIDEQIVIPNGGDGFYGIYGAAVDQNDDFWGVGFTNGPLVHIRKSDLVVETFTLAQTGAYGFTVDHAGRPWVGYYGGVMRFNPGPNDWTIATVPAGYTTLSRGMQEDAAGHLWIAAMSTGLLGIDTDSAMWMADVQSNILGPVSQTAGVSVDIDGMVWLVDTGANGAFVYDPLANSAQFVGGLVGPYTYSDMTGWGLKNVANPQG